MWFGAQLTYLKVKGRVGKVNPSLVRLEFGKVERLSVGMLENLLDFSLYTSNKHDVIYRDSSSGQVVVRRSGSGTSSI